MPTIWPTIALTLAVCGFCCLNNAAATQLRMLPLSAADVYRWLHRNGKEDAVPEGRVITQGLAALSGFTLGLTKAIGGVLLYDIITANVTDLDLATGASSANTASNNAATTPREICFNSRKARSLEEANAFAAAYRDDTKGNNVNLDSKIIKRNKRDSNHKRKHKYNRQNKLKEKKPKRKRGHHHKSNSRIKKVNLSSKFITSDGISPTTTTTNLGTGTNIDTGTGTRTSSASTTSTDGDNSVNCVIVQNPR